MKSHLIIGIIMVTLLGCSTKKRGDNFSYIKVLTEDLTDSITTYNKGLALHNFLYYDPQKDSVVFRFIVSVEPLRYKTYIGKFGNEQYLDTIANLIDKLRHHPNGFLPTDFIENSSGGYDGANFFVEYKDNNGIHNNSFIVSGNDTLYQFDYFFHRLLKLPWERRLVDNYVVNADSEIVETAKRTGLYENIELPYVPLSCEASIDMTKIFGTWRTAGNIHDKNRINFYKLTLTKSGICYSEEIRDGVSQGRTSATYVLNARDNTITIETNKAKYHYTVLKLNDNCFEYKDEDKNYLMRYERI